MQFLVVEYISQSVDEKVVPHLVAIDDLFFRSPLFLPSHLSPSPVNQSMNMSQTPSPSKFYHQLTLSSNTSANIDPPVESFAQPLMVIVQERKEKTMKFYSSWSIKNVFVEILSYRTWTIVSNHRTVPIISTRSINIISLNYKERMHGIQKENTPKSMMATSSIIST